MLVAQFRCTVLKKTRERAVDVAEAEKAEIERADGGASNEPGFKVSTFQRRAAASAAHPETLKL